MQVATASNWRHGFHSGVRILEGMEQVEDEDNFPSGKNLLAGLADPERPVGQNHLLLGLEHAVLERDLPRTGAGLVLPRLSSLRVQTVGREAGDGLRLAGLRQPPLEPAHAEPCRPGLKPSDRRNRTRRESAKLANFTLALTMSATGTCITTCFLHPAGER